MFSLVVSASSQPTWVAAGIRWQQTTGNEGSAKGECLITDDCGDPDGGPDPIPLPAAGWLLIGGVGALVAMKRRQKAA